jgi:hypothetical protein
MDRYVTYIDNLSIDDSLSDWKTNLYSETGFYEMAITGFNVHVNKSKGTMAQKMNDNNLVFVKMPSVISQMNGNK